MAKTLKQFKQGYTPRSADEKKFVDKHTVSVKDDANKNDDKLFKASNIKTVDRETEHGYNPGSDEEVYEQTSVSEKKLTSAEMKKREEVAKALERENPSMPMAKKMAIATATAKKVAESKGEMEDDNEKEDKVPFEGPYKKQPDAHGPKSRARHLAKMAMQKVMQKVTNDAAATAVAMSKKKVTEDTETIKQYLLSLYEDKVDSEELEILQEMLEDEQGTKAALLITMLINEDSNLLDEITNEKKPEKYSHDTFLKQLKRKKTGV